MSNDTNRMVSKFIHRSVLLCPKNVSDTFDFGSTHDDKYFLGGQQGLIQCGLLQLELESKRARIKRLKTPHETSWNSLFFQDYWRNIWKKKKVGEGTGKSGNKVVLFLAVPVFFLFLFWSMFLQYLLWDSSCGPIEARRSYKDPSKVRRKLVNGTILDSKFCFYHSTFYGFYHVSYSIRFFLVSNFLLEI